MGEFHQATTTDINIIAGMMASAFFAYPFVCCKPKTSRKAARLCMMNNCIFPYVEQKQGQSILLATNTEPALKFYTGNGFEVIAHDKISYMGEIFKKWDLCKTLRGKA